MIKGLKGKKKGFSLVELIVVIAIIGILAAIAVPKYSQYQKTAKEKADVATAEALANATSMYILNFDKDLTSEINFATALDGKTTTGTDSTVGNAILATMVKPPIVKRGVNTYTVKVDSNGNVEVTLTTGAIPLYGK